jgi:hypothetical protein
VGHDWEGLSGRQTKLQVGTAWLIGRTAALDWGRSRVCAHCTVARGVPSAGPRVATAAAVPATPHAHNDADGPMELLPSMERAHWRPHLQLLSCCWTALLMQQHTHQVHVHASVKFPDAERTCECRHRCWG